jgi:hypothetical protein
MDMTTLCTLLLFWALLFGQSSCFTIIRVSGFSTSKLYHTKIISWNLGDVKYRQLFSAIRDEMCCPDDMTEHEEPIVSSHSVGGNIVVSGLSDNEEFTLSLLNNQVYMICTTCVYHETSLMQHFATGNMAKSDMVDER